MAVSHTEGSSEKVEREGGSSSEWGVIKMLFTFQTSLKKGILAGSLKGCTFARCRSKYVSYHAGTDILAVAFKSEQASEHPTTLKQART